MEQDEAGTLAALKEWGEAILQPLIVEYQGRIVKVMGDGILVEFEIQQPRQNTRYREWDCRGQPPSSGKLQREHDQLAHCNSEKLPASRFIADSSGTLAGCRGWTHRGHELR
jgi:class 3 adenylate cyclase